MKPRLVLLPLVLAAPLVALVCARSFASPTLASVVLGLFGEARHSAPAADRRLLPVSTQSRQSGP